MVPSSTQSARCSGDISLEIPGQASARPTSSEIGSLVIGVLGEHAVHEVQSGVQQRIREDGDRVAPKVVDPPRDQRRNSLSDIDT